MSVRFTIQNWILLALCVCCVVFGLAGIANAQTNQPAIEYSSLMDAFTVKFQGKNGQGKTGGRMVLNQKHEIIGVFFPAAASLKVELSKQGDSKVLYSEACTVTPSGGSAFSRIQVGGAEGYVFTEEGDYDLRFVLGGKTITTMPFTVMFKKSGDAFNPKMFTFVDGPWSNLAYLSCSAEKEESPLKFNTWTRKIVFTTTPKPSKMDVTLLQGDEVVAVTAQGTVAWPEWQTREVTFSFPTNQGGKVFNNTDLMKRSGKHTVRVDLDGKPHQYFDFDVKDGQIIGHERQSMEFSQRDRWLCPRKITLGLEGTGHVFWMERSEAAASDVPAKFAGPSSETKSKWVVDSDVDPNRSFEIVHTDIRMRKDMRFSIGDGIVAYATGRQGVGYFNVGENKPRSIKDGQSFRGDLFFACGKLIMMATRNNVTVFSTEVERSVEIPADEIFLSYQTHSDYGPRFADADGLLVATVNEPAKLKSKSIINVIDLSGDNRPIIIPIKNSDFELRDVTSIRVNAAAGKVAVGSKREGAIYVADVAPNASFRKYDISGFDSFGEENMVLTESTVLYTDAAGFANVRMLDLASGEVIMPDSNQYGGGWGPVGASNGSSFAWAIKDPRYAWAIGDAKAATLSNTGQRSDPNFGNYGAGRSMAMANEGTVFIAGTRSISQRSCLQATQNGQWQFVKDPETGNPIPAIDVTAGSSMIVFKTGKPSTSSEVKLSYATFGSMVILPDTAQANASGKTDSTLTSSKTESKEAETKLSEVDQAFLDQVLENEEVIFNALKNTLSEKEARKKARETGINAIKASGRDKLIEAYKNTWK